MTEQDIQVMAQAAAAHWGISTPARLIKMRENIVLETRTPEGIRAALRLHRPGYQTVAAIRSELWWSEALVAAGMRVPQPIRSQTDDVVAQLPEGRVASLVSWLDGTPLGEGGVALAMPDAEQMRLHEALGRCLAQLHSASDAMTPPEGFERPILDAAALLGPAPAWGRFWENPSLSSAESETLLAARTRLRDILSRHAERGDFGLIHADALRENILVQDGDVRLIDFDDGVFGFRMYELGVAMSQNWDQPNQPALGAALLRGYGQLRALPDDAPALLTAFTVMRGLASCGWVIGRYKAQDPAVRDYAERALNLVARWQN